MPSAQSSSQNENFVGTSRKLLKNRNDLWRWRVKGCAKVQKGATRDVKKVFFKNSQNSQSNTCARVSFKKNSGAKKTLVFSCEFCKISKNTFFTEHLWTTDSVGN